MLHPFGGIVEQVLLILFLLHIALLLLAVLPLQYMNQYRHEQRGWRRLDTSAVFSLGRVIVYPTIGAVRGTSSGARRRSKVAAVSDRADTRRS